MITGSIVALITPFQANGEVDYKALRKLVEWHVAEGTDGIVAVGTTGESATLSVAEHVRVIEAIVETAGDKVPVIAGTGANCTREACELTAEAASLGVAACLIVVPYYNKPTQQGLYHHFRTIAEAVAIPQILYNVPGRTACDLLPETVARLASIDNIVGIKEATGSVERGREIMERVRASHFALYSGDDGSFLELMKNGAVGNISVTANVAPAMMHRICAAALAGDFPQAEEWNASLAPLHSALFLEANPIPVKWACARLGLCEPGLRLPLTELDPSYHAQVEDALRAAGLLP